MVTVEYSSNNSGGRWWLKDKDWKALEKAGWWVEWGGLEFCHSNWDPKNPPLCASSKDCPGHRKFEAPNPAKTWLGALAKAARKDFPSLRDGVEEFERITGQNADDEGCNCCGRPHNFSGKTAEGKHVYFESSVSGYVRSYGEES